MSTANNDEQKNELLKNIKQIELSDTISQFMEKCNDNFSIISKVGGGPKGVKGDEGSQGAPTKPKVPIHVWREGVEYKGESILNEGYEINSYTEDLTDVKYQEGHLIVLKNGHVYILEKDDKLILKPNYIISLQSYNPDDVIDGKNAYVHIAFANSSDGKEGFILSEKLTDSDERKYMGIYSDDKETSTINQSRYNWIKIVGNVGDKGDKGDKGEKGDKGDKGDKGEKGDKGDSFTGQLYTIDLEGDMSTISLDVDRTLLYDKSGDYCQCIAHAYYGNKHVKLLESDINVVLSSDYKYLKNGDIVLSSNENSKVGRIEKVQSGEDDKDVTIKFLPDSSFIFPKTSIIFTIHVESEIYDFDNKKNYNFTRDVVWSIKGIISTFELEIVPNYRTIKLDEFGTYFPSTLTVNIFKINDTERSLFNLKDNNDFTLLYKEYSQNTWTPYPDSGITIGSSMSCLEFKVVRYYGSTDSEKPEEIWDYEDVWVVSDGKSTHYYHADLGCTESMMVLTTGRKEECTNSEDTKIYCAELKNKSGYSITFDPKFYDGATEIEKIDSVTIGTNSDETYEKEGTFVRELTSKTINGVTKYTLTITKVPYGIDVIPMNIIVQAKDGDDKILTDSVSFNVYISTISDIYTLVPTVSAYNTSTGSDADKIGCSVYKNNELVELEDLNIYGLTLEYTIHSENNVKYTNEYTKPLDYGADSDTDKDVFSADDVAIDFILFYSGKEIVKSTVPLIKDGIDGKDADFDVKYSSVEENPGNPTDNQSNWTDNPSNETIWMATRHMKNDIWSNWVVTRIKGEKGDRGSAPSVERVEILGYSLTQEHINDLDKWVDSIDMLGELKVGETIYILNKYFWNDGSETKGITVTLAGTQGNDGKSRVLFYLGSYYSENRTLDPNNTVTGLLNDTRCDYYIDGNNQAWMRIGTESEIEGHYDGEEDNDKSCWEKSEKVGFLQAGAIHANMINTDSLVADTAVINAIKSTEISADYIKTGTISSDGGKSYFDLNNGDFVLGNVDGAALKYTSKTGTLTIGGINDGSDKSILERLGVIENIEIGGRNILSNTETMGEWQPIGWNGATITKNTNNLYENGKYATQIVSEGGDSKYKVIYELLNKDKDKIDFNREYTLSFNVKAIEHNLCIRCKLSKEIGVNTYYEETNINAGDSVRVTFTGYPFSNQNLQLWFGAADCPNIDDTERKYVTNFYINELKLEYGNKATDWSPSTDETDAKSLMYLKDAFQNNTDISGGLVATSQIQLRDWDDTTKEYKVNAGISGIKNDNVLLWGGGTYDEAVNAASTDNDFHVGEEKTGKKITSILKKDGTGKIGCFYIDEDTIEVKPYNGMSVSITTKSIDDYRSGRNNGNGINTNGINTYKKSIGDKNSNGLLTYEKTIAKMTLPLNESVRLSVGNIFMEDEYGSNEGFDPYVYAKLDVNAKRKDGTLVESYNITMDSNTLSPVILDDLVNKTFTNSGDTSSVTTIEISLKVKYMRGIANVKFDYILTKESDTKQCVLASDGLVISCGLNQRFIIKPNTDVLSIIADIPDLSTVESREEKAAIVKSLEVGQLYTDSSGIVRRFSSEDKNNEGKALKFESLFYILYQPPQSSSQLLKRDTIDLRDFQQIYGDFIDTDTTTTSQKD